MKAEYTCNCIHYQEIFDDATAMAQTVENAETISKKSFYEQAEVIPEHKKLKQAEYNQHENLLILHDTTKDIHYFYL